MANAPNKNVPITSCTRAIAQAVDPGGGSRLRPAERWPPDVFDLEHLP